MQDYFEKYREFSENVDMACECINSYRCSRLGSEIELNKDTLNKLNINESTWGDSVADGFITLKNSFVNNLDSIIDSIDTTFTESEELYENLKELLANLKELNTAYQKKYKGKPDQEDYYHHVKTGEDENGKDIYDYRLDRREYTAALDKWQREVKKLESDCENLIEQIESKKNELDNIDGIKISVSDINTSLGNSVSEFQNIISSNEKILYDSLFKTDGTREGNAKAIWNFLKHMGLSDAAAAGVLGNIQAESHFDPDIYEGSSQKNSRRKGYGLIQWTNYKGRKGGRRDQLFSAAKSSGADPSSLRFQLEYLWKESLDPNSGYGKNLKKSGFYTTDDPTEAAYLFHKYVEISADSKSAISSNRCKPASEWYNKFSGSEIYNI